MNMEELLAEHGVEFAPSSHHHVTSNWLQMDCPFCSPKAKRYRLGFRRDGGWFHCWVCGWHPPTETFSLLTGVSRDHARRLLVGVVAERVKAPGRAQASLVLPVGLEKALRPAHRRYLKDRGFNAQEIETLWRVQGLGPFAMQSLRWRLFIPIYSEGVMVSWTSRAIGERSDKYHTARPDQEAIYHRDLLYGEDYVRNAIVICEGPLDVWAVGPGAVATFSVNYSRRQLLRLSRYPSRVVCYDRDRSGQRRAACLVRSLSCFPGRTFNVQLETGKDPASADPKEVIQLRERFLT